MPIGNFKSKYPLLYNAFQLLHSENPVKKNLFEFMRTFNYDKLFLFISNLRTESLLKILNISKTLAINLTIKKIERTTEPKWKNRESIYLEMLKNGVAKSTLDNQEKILQLLNGYYEIRRERNNLNHANSNKRKEIDELEKMIVTYLDEIEKF